MSAQGQHAAGAAGDAYGRGAAQPAGHAAVPGYGGGDASGYDQYGGYSDPAAAHGAGAYAGSGAAGASAGYDTSGYNAMGRGSQVGAPGQSLQLILIIVH